MSAPSGNHTNGGGSAQPGSNKPRLPTSVLCLQAAVDELYTCAQVGTNMVDPAKSLAEAARRLCLPIVNSCTEFEIERLAPLAAAHIGLCQITIEDCNALLHKQRLSGTVERKSELEQYTVVLQALADQLKLTNGVAMLIVNPAAGFGRSAEYPQSSTADRLSASRVDRRFKAEISAIEGMCDRAEWPLDVIFESIVLFIELYERFVTRPAPVQDIMSSVRTRIEGLTWHRDSMDEDLRRSMEAFFCGMQRIIMIFRVIHTLRGKNTAAIEIVLIRLVAESDKMRSAHAELSVRHIALPESEHRFLVTRSEATLTNRIASESTPADEYLHSVPTEHSIEALVDLLPSPAVDFEPLQLLTICALLPSGLFPDVFDKVSASFSDPVKAVRPLLHHGLATYGFRGELRMLTSVRLYVWLHYPATPSHALKLEEIYLSLARELPLAGLPGWEVRKTDGLNEFANMCAVLTPPLERTPPTRQLFQAMERLITFSIAVERSIPHLTDATSLRSSKTDVHLRAHYTGALIYHRFFKAQYTAIRELLSTGVAMHRNCRACSMYSVARATVLAEIDRTQGRFDGASRRLAQLRVTVEQLEDEQVLGSYHAHCGRVEIEQKNCTLAKLHFRIAIYAYDRAGNEGAVLDAKTWLSQAELAEGNVVVAFKNLEVVQTRSHSTQNYKVLGRCISLLGQIHMFEGRLELAERCALDAWRLETTRGHPYSIAECDYRLAVILMKLQRGSEATEAAVSAAMAYRKIEIEHEARSCDRLIERITSQSESLDEINDERIVSEFADEVITPQGRPADLPPDNSDGNWNAESAATDNGAVSTHTIFEDLDYFEDDATSTVFDDTSSVHVAAKNFYYRQSYAESVGTLNSLIY